jgi:hypothetical protein
VIVKILIKLNGYSYLCTRENECKIVKWQLGGFALSDQDNIKIYSAMDWVKKIPLLKYN